MRARAIPKRGGLGGPLDPAAVKQVLTRGQPKGAPQHCDDETGCRYTAGWQGEKVAGSTITQQKVKVR